MGEPGLGDVAFLGIGEEADTTWGTEAERTVFVRLLSESLKLNGGFNFPVTGTFGHEQRYSLKQPVFVDGEVECEMNYEGFALLLKHLLGGHASAQVGSSTAYTHHIAPVTNIPGSLSLEIDRDLQAHVFTGSKILSASFAQARGEPLMARFAVIGKAEVIDTATAETFPSDLPVLDEHFSLEIDDTAALISEWSLDVNNSFSGGDRSDLGSLAIKEPVRVGKQVITGAITAEFDDTKQYNNFVDRVSHKLAFLFTGATFDTDTADHTYQLNMYLEKCLLITGQAPVAGIGPIIQSFAFQAIYNTTGTTGTTGTKNAIRFELTNKTTALGTTYA